jgi:hypothetical protein
MNDKFVLVSMDDQRTKEIADAITNKSCKKILEYLSEVKEASATDLSKATNMHMNTVHYSINKLLKSELIERSKNFFWSVKGKKIDMYRVSRKSIVISPKRKTIGFTVLLTIIFTGLFAMLLKYLIATKTFVTKSIPEQILSTSGELRTGEFVHPWWYSIYYDLPTWAWFFLGALFALIIFLVIDFIRRKLK